MALMARGGKSGRMSAQNWASFSGVCFIGLLVAIVSFSHVVRKGGAPTFSSSTGSTKYRRISHPSDINCDDELGAGRKYIPAQHQYHPVLVGFSLEDTSDQQVCRSKYKQHCYWKYSKQYIPSTSFLLALRRYEAQHRRCTEDLPLTALVQKGLAPTKCQYLVWRDLDGKGNQLISLVSAFVYALLTDRVLLITRGAQLQHLLCDPFHGSSWLLPEDFPDDRIRESAEVHGMFYDRALNLSTTITGSMKETLDVPKILEAFMSNWQQPADLKFFCEGEQRLLREIPWVFFRSNQYSVPGMYFVPSFRSQLNIWFPDRAVFLHAGRYLLNPQNEIWELVTNVYRTHMASADRRLAIQVRAWSNAYTPVISEHILACAVYAGMMPNVSSSTTPADDSVNVERISVVVASLQKEYADRLAEAFNKSVSLAGAASRVNIFSPSAEGMQQTGQLVHEKKVIADMWLLSFADEIISSPKSTFGYVSHGLAGIKPIVFNQYGIDKVDVPNPPCWRTNLPGPCFIDHPHNMECPLDDPISYIGDAHTDLPEIRSCELQWGIGVFEENDTVG